MLESFSVGFRAGPRGGRMKECPVCKESFGDELFFCDLDGTPLDGAAGVADHGSSSKVWSILGVVALLGAVVVSAVAIIFFPRGFSPSVSASKVQGTDSGSRSPLVVSAGKSSDTDQTGSPSVLEATAPDANSNRADRNANADSVAKLAAKRAQLLQNQNGDPTLPNPKAAFASDSGAAKETQVSDAPPARPRVSATPDVPALNTQVKSIDKPADASDKPDQQSPAFGKNAKKKATKSDSTDKETNSNKKKGGFLKMFKKIFG